MPRIEKILAQMRNNSANVKFADLVKVCDHHFGPARNRGGSHRTYRTPRQGDPRVNIQNDHGNAKPYQATQVLAAIDKIKKEEA